MNTFRNALLATAVLTFVGAGAVHAALMVSGSVGGAPTGVTLDNLDWLTLGATGGVLPQSGVTITFAGNAQAVQGSVGG
jgi:hypothetical protein